MLRVNWHNINDNQPGQIPFNYWSYTPSTLSERLIYCLNLLSTNSLKLSSLLYPSFSCKSPSGLYKSLSGLKTTTKIAFQANTNKSKPGDCLYSVLFDSHPPSVLRLGFPPLYLLGFLPGQSLNRRKSCERLMLIFCALFELQSTSGCSLEMIEEEVNELIQSGLATFPNTKQLKSGQEECFKIF